jgi:1,4-dihydroxy-2-naphthoate octaprenyltransferase
MFKKSTWLHLRLPFSYFLLPIYLFAISLSPNISEKGLLGLLIILHVLIYPASNAYNSYYDKDEGSIGGLKNPPKVDKNVYYLATLFDVIGLVSTQLLFLNWTLTLMVLVYIIVSRAYSNSLIRLKRFAIISWLIAGFFQGAWVVWLTYIGLNEFEFHMVFKPKVVYGGLLASAILWGSYPMTQIYQHEEDAKRGDKTLSLLLGVKGTFLFTAFCFGLAVLGYIFYFQSFFNTVYAWHFLIAMSPVVLFFGWWMMRTWTDQSRANYVNTMRLNFISATALSLFFIYLFLDSTKVLNVVGVY